MKFVLIKTWGSGETGMEGRNAAELCLGLVAVSCI